MKYKYDPKNFKDVFATELGQKLWARITQKATIYDMQLATKLRKPAVEPIGEMLLGEFGDAVRERRVKQMIGHMARQVMEADGYELEAQRVPTTSSELFSTASRYRVKSAAVS